MKRIILLSGFVLTQTIFATTLTIYNSNIALVQESQEIEIQKDEKEFVYDNLPNTLLDNSVDIKLPKEVTLYSQSYRPKRISQQDLAKNKELTNKLTFDIKSAKTLKADVKLSYLAQNISFAADYVLNIHKDQVNLTAWIDITNNSGKDFKNATVNLLAGDISRAYSHPQPVMYRSNMTAMDKTAKPTHKAVSSYHKYTLPRKIDLNTYQKHRVKLFGAENISIKSDYTALMNNPLYLMGERSSRVTHNIHLKGLQKELPAGIVRIYRDDEGEKLLLGENSIANTPKNAPLKLQVGKDFDTKVTQTMHSRNDTKTAFDVTVTYKLLNNSDEDKMLTLQIPFNKKQSSRIHSKLKYVYTKGNLVTFTLKVKANSERSFDVRFQSNRR
ncbi:DUF4139 domain-containing protein [Sulfurimonas paralvinellae]|uniref:DUF4139 domain-containing protein n=1 Tax=Sulfurimonas paralvinellae TaxID=317658 RepID=A0A7M1B8L0_9BACT|nr:DUF4139 domain-containing protein [Sulfurimonas paralvinellae]QOP45082.1 DUF4139 domain-containing protein [Sulfurimonas paralvinellae]